jgi:hypothetical protein
MGKAHSSEVRNTATFILLMLTPGFMKIGQLVRNLLEGGGTWIRCHNHGRLQEEGNVLDTVDLQNEVSAHTN